jgi:predicted DNA-binding WGR domain protein
VQNQLHVRTGKTGTKGQTQVRTFATDEEALAVRQTFIEEKQGEGFTTQQEK